MLLGADEFTVRTDETAVHNISGQVAAVVEDIGVTQGICLVYCPHSTAAITINEDNAALHEDFLDTFHTVAPPDGDYHHDETDHNAHAHIVSSLLGASCGLPVIDGTLATGTWQDVLLVETAGPQDRTVMVQIVGE